MSVRLFLASTNILNNEEFAVAHNKKLRSRTLSQQLQSSPGRGAFPPALILIYKENHSLTLGGQNWIKHHP